MKVHADFRKFMKMEIILNLSLLLFENLGRLNEVRSYFGSSSDGIANQAGHRHLNVTI